MPQLVIDLAWRIEGPFLTAGGDIYGSFDSCFHRDGGYWLSVSKTHVKGKLLEALRHVADVYGIPGASLDWWMGAPNDKANQSERVFVSGLIPQKDATPGRRDLEPGNIDQPETPTVSHVYRDFSSLLSPTTRLKADHAQRTAIGESGTAEAHTLRIEEIQPRGLPLWWTGRIESAGPDPAQLQALASLIQKAVRCVSQLGADKGVGYGKVVETRFSCRIAGDQVVLSPLGDRTVAQLAASAHKPAWNPNPESPRQRTSMGLEVIPLEPIFIAGVKRKDSHFHEGLDHVPGSALKGAVAAALNLRVGMPLDAPIGTSNSGVHTSWPDLAAHFEAIRFLHALPGGIRGVDEPKRSFPIPLSAFATSKRAVQVADAALDAIPTSILPWFAPDCSELSGYATTPGNTWAALETVHVARSTVLRTAIDPLKLRAADQQLFGYSEISELVRSDDGTKAVPARQSFVTSVALPDDGNGLGDRIKQQLSQVLPHIRLGKTNAAVAVRSRSLASTALADRLAGYRDLPIILTLLSDALLPIVGHRVEGTTDMTAIYDRAWKQILQKCGYDHGDAPLVADVFARQGLRGGWSGHRGRSNEYRCFHLTEAGSVFVTGVPANQCPEGLRKALVQLETLGIPILEPGTNWQNCLYVPENGYGEVVACHPWHLDRRVSGSSSEGVDK